MINNIDTLSQIEEENLDLTMYQVESGLDDLFSLMQHCRHNNPALFEENLCHFKELSARVLEMTSRVKSMSNMIMLEKAMSMGGAR